MKVKKVFKYPTGGIVPEGAQYLCTKTETRTTSVNDDISVRENALVWHYFLVEVDEDE